MQTVFRHPRPGLILWAALSALPMLQACESPPSELDEGHAADDESREAETSVTTDEVRRVQAHLKHYGYLPSDALRERHPHIEFFVEDDAEDGVLDLPTIEALQHFQVRNGLEPTGIPDEATLAAMDVARCGHPDAPTQPQAQPQDRDGEEGSRQKFAFEDYHFGGRRASTIRVHRYPRPLASIRGRIDDAIDRAAQEYSRRSGFEFHRVSSGAPDIQVHFYADNDGPSGCADFSTTKNKDVLAVLVTNYNQSNGQVVGAQLLCVNASKNWSYNNANGSGHDFETIVLHELGHAAGLSHSSVSNTVMWPTVNANTQRRSLTRDDLHGMWSRYGRWIFSNAGVGVRDMAWSRTSVLWAISNRPAGAGGYEIWRRTRAVPNQYGEIDGPWERVNGAAVRIAHDGERAWVVNANGTLYSRNDADTAWQASLNCIRDFDGIAGTIYAFVDCEGRIYTLSGGLGVVELPAPPFSNFTIQRVAIDKVNYSIWVTSPAGLSYRYRWFVDANWVPYWNALVQHIDGAWDGSMWGAHHGKLYLWNEQPEIPGQEADKPAAPARSQWLPYPGTGDVIAGSTWGAPTMAPLNQRVSDMQRSYVW